MGASYGTGEYPKCKTRAKGLQGKHCGKESVVYCNKGQLKHFQFCFVRIEYSLFTFSNALPKETTSLRY